MECVLRIELVTHWLPFSNDESSEKRKEEIIEFKYSGIARF